MHSKLSIQELVTSTLDELKRLKYSEITRNKYLRTWNKLINFANSNKQTHFTEELGAKFLKHYYDFPSNQYDYTNALPPNIRFAVRCIRVLGDYQLHGSILRKRSKKEPFKYPDQFKDGLLKYEKECINRQYSIRSMRLRTSHLTAFVTFLESRKVTSFSNIASSDLSSFANTLAGYHVKTIASALSDLRTFLKFLYLNGFHTKDMSNNVPHVKYQNYTRIPSVWKKQDVNRMLESIDRGSPLGKRDYAILLLVTHLGMRIGDIKSLTLSNLKWDTKQIEFKQQKTGHTIRLPLLDGVGWAIIDYLKNSRPHTDSPYLFLRFNAPFEPFGHNANLHSIIKKYIKLAKIEIPLGNHHGMHSLRHTLASTLLEQNTPLPVISEILGHINVNSTEIYLKINVEELRKCAIDPEEVLKYA